MCKKYESYPTLKLYKISFYMKGLNMGRGRICIHVHIHEAMNKWPWVPWNKHVLILCGQIFSKDKKITQALEIKYELSYPKLCIK